MLANIFGDKGDFFIVVAICAVMYFRKQDFLGKVNIHLLEPFEIHLLIFSVTMKAYS